VGDIFTLMDKLERAMVKGTGLQISATELRVMIDEDIVDVILAAKIKRLKAGFRPPQVDRDPTT
jgi:hypothetical protein